MTTFEFIFQKVSDDEAEDEMKDEEKREEDDAPKFKDVGKDETKGINSRFSASRILSRPCQLQCLETQVME